MSNNNSEVIKDASSKARVNLHKYNKPKYFAALLELLLSMVFVTGVQWVSMGLSIDAWKNPQFWTKSLGATIGVFLLYKAIITMRFEKTANRPKVVKAKEKYNELMESKDLDLKEFLQEYNLSSKIEAYVSTINSKIIKLENKLKRTYKDKQIVKLNNKIDKLKELITDDYIEEHIDHLKVNYYIVYYSDFTTDSTDSGTPNLITRANYTKALNKASLNKMGVYMISCMLLSISVFKIGVFDWTEFLANLFASSFLIVTRSVSALMEADPLYDRTILAAILDKNEILTQYVTWKEEHPTQTKLQEEKKKLEDKIRAEITAECNDKMKAELIAYKQELLEKANIS